MYGIPDLVLGIASDGAADVCAAIRDLPYMHTVCFVHTVSNVVKDVAVILERYLKPLRQVVDALMLCFAFAAVFSISHSSSVVDCTL